MRSVGSKAALVLWKEEKLPAPAEPYRWPAQPQPDENLWPALRELFGEDRAALDAACEAASSGPIRFDLDSAHGIAMSSAPPGAEKPRPGIGHSCTLELRDGNKEAAWTNLLAATRLVTAWDPEPLKSRTAFDSPAQLSHTMPPGRPCKRTAGVMNAWLSSNTSGPPSISSKASPRRKRSTAPPPRIYASVTATKPSAPPLFSETCSALPGMSGLDSSSIGAESVTAITEAMRTTGPAALL